MITWRASGRRRWGHDPEHRRRAQPRPGRGGAGAAPDRPTAKSRRARRGRSAPVTQAANFGDQRPQEVSQPVSFNAQPAPGAFPTPALQPGANPSVRGLINGLTPRTTDTPAFPEKREIDAPVDQERVVDLDGQTEQEPDRSGETPKANGADANSAVSFSLSPQPIRERIGKSFTVAVEVRGGRQMSGRHRAQIRRHEAASEIGAR